jgi:hypothetical protein
VKNLLSNPGFNDGHHHQDGIAEIVVPDWWVLCYLDGKPFPGIGDNPGVAYRPESVVWNIKGAPEHEKDLFFLDGDYCLKVFKAWAPVYFALVQHVKGLMPGKRYRFNAQVFPDIVETYNGSEKIYPTDIWSAEARAGWSPPGLRWPAGQDGDIHWSDWFNKANGNFEFGEYGDVWVEFTAPEGGEVEVWLECKAKWGFQNNWFMDAFSLICLDGDEPEPEPSTDSSKLGPHVLRRKDGDGLDEWLAKAPVVKLCGEWGLAQTDTIHPNALVIGRVHSDFNAGDQRGQEPAEAAVQFVESQLETYKSNPGIIYWEGHNEPVWSTPEDMAWCAQFEIARMEVMAAKGLRCVIGNFSTGQPDLGLWPYFLEAMEAALKHEAILGLHEYSSPWIWWMYGDNQVDPNADEGDEGWLTCRYRKAYRDYFIPNGVGEVPLVITECGLDIVTGPEGCPVGAWKNLWDFWATNDGESNPHNYYVDQLSWYEDRLREDPYVVGATVFTCGHWNTWEDHDISGTPVIEMLADCSKPRIKPFVYPEVVEPASTGRGAPREQYERTYVLLHPGADWLWYAAIAAATEDLRYTIGASADDAGIGDLDYRRVFATNPDLWNGNLAEFFDIYYSGVELHLLDAGSPFEAAVLLRLVAEEHALSQNDPLWKGKDFGEQPGGYTIGQRGCFLTNFTMILRRVYRRDLTPPILDRLLTLARYPYIDDIELANWDETVGLFTVFDDSLKVNRSYSATELQKLHNAGWHIILRVSGGAHFVLYDSPYNDRLVRVVDPWDGVTKLWGIADVSGIRAAHVDQSQVQSGFTLRGIHDAAGGDYLIEQGLEGWCVLPVYLGATPQKLNLAKYVRNGVRPIVRLSYSYAVDDGGEGTMPGPDKVAGYEMACFETVDRSLEGLTDEEKAQVFWIYCNEMNNPREWPDGYDLTPEYYQDSYNWVWDHIPSGAQFGPGAIDPYNPGWGDWRETWRWVLENIVSAECIAIHAYCHDADLNRIDSDQRFSDDPLQGVHYDLLVASDQINILPSWARADVPLLITECNHYRRDDGPVGWNADADEWMELAHRKLASLGFDAVCWFRFNHDQWRMNDKPRLLDVLRNIS